MRSMCHSPRSALIVLRPDRLRPGRSREIIADSTKPSKAQVPYKGEDTEVLKLSGSRERIKEKLRLWGRMGSAIYFDADM